jgi:hypothetical protein
MALEPCRTEAVKDRSAAKRLRRLKVLTEWLGRRSLGEGGELGVWNLRCAEVNVAHERPD